MFDDVRWEAMSFSFMVFDQHYFKNAGSMNYMINDVYNEFASDQLEVPALIMTLEDEAPGVLWPID